MVTLAPELPGAEAVTRELVGSGVVVAAGHTTASYEEASDAFSWGISHVTHLFNAMPPLDHRSPGLVGALIEDRPVTAGLIVDGHHSHPSVVAGAWKWLGPERLALVTDAMAAAGMGDGDFHIGHVPVTVVNGKVTNLEGRLAGSTLSLDQAVRNLIAFTGCGESEALACATRIPAHIIGRPDLGRIEIGELADLTFFDDDLNVVGTMVGGEVVWRRDTP
jgi:N-acetylglucosamine-6-phosphate deacetylase